MKLAIRTCDELRAKLGAAATWQGEADNPAPLNTRVIVYKQGGLGLATKDEHGQWRKQWGGPMHVAPQWWMLPEKPPHE